MAPSFFRARRRTVCPIRQKFALLTRVEAGGCQLLPPRVACFEIDRHRPQPVRNAKADFSQTLPPLRPLDCYPGPSKFGLLNARRNLPRLRGECRQMNLRPPQSRHRYRRSFFATLAEDGMTGWKMTMIEP